MDAIGLLRAISDETWKELLISIDGVSEHQAWARVECQPGEYMHTEGSILSNVVHVASCKVMYASCAYRDVEVRQRDTVERLQQVWPSWDSALAWLHEAHEYWMSSWGETDLEGEVMRFDGKMSPSWKIIWTMAHHDSYHAGQIQLLRSTLPPSSNPPPDESDIWRQYCCDLPTW